MGNISCRLNYVPILGPLIGVLIFLLAGLLSIDTLWVAFLPAGLYLSRGENQPHDDFT